MGLEKGASFGAGNLSYRTQPQDYNIIPRGVANTLALKLADAQAKGPGVMQVLTLVNFCQYN